MNTVKIENVESFILSRTEGYKEVTNPLHREWVKLNASHEEDIADAMTTIIRKDDEVEMAFATVIRTRGAAWWKSM